jgi:hypothetical protein
MNENLHSIQEHLKSAPGPYLSRLRTKFTQKNGLVQNSKILGELCNEILNEERLQKWMQKRSEWEIQALGLIYASGTRGLHFKELERSLDTDQKSLLAFLNDAAGEMFIWHAKCQSSSIYYGFANFEDYFLNLLFKNEETTEAVVWASNERKAELHLILLLAKIQLGKISIKKDSSLSHNARKHIAEITSNEDGLCLLLSFLLSEKWISKPTENGYLKLLPPAYDFLQNNGIRIFSQLLFWWQKERFHDKGDLQKLLKFFAKPISALSAAWLFWPYDTGLRLPKNKSSISWQYLPRPLRELWLLGVLKMQTKKKNILSFSLSEFGESVFFAKRAKENLSEPIISSSSNYEWILSQNNGALRIFQMACLAQAKNEEDPLRFSISKESFLAGLHSGLPNKFVKDFLSWSKAVPNVAASINEWHHIYSDSSIDSLSILRIRNQEKFAELSKYKPLQSCVEEAIPNWGFVIKEGHEKKIREMLAHFSLEPHSCILDKTKEEPLTKFAETENFAIPCPAAEGGDLMFV